jgi:hypothetical protein
MQFRHLLWLTGFTFLAAFSPVHATDLASAPTISDALHGTCSPSFWVERKAGQWKIADATSFFNKNTNELDRCTFDVGNGTTLANMSPGGAIRTLTMYRDGYRAMTPGWACGWARIARPTVRTPLRWITETNM